MFRCQLKYIGYGALIMSVCFVLVFAIIIFTSNGGDVDSKIVNTVQGPVRGYKSAEWDIYEFYGIPYATAPKGEDKFKGPLPSPTWTNTLDAVDDTVVCPQHRTTLEQYGFGANYDEDGNCLVANVLVSNTDDNNKPVLVYIYGGGYQSGYGTFLQPKTIVEEGNIVAVTFNYRLSIEGFLCLGTEKVPGNAGIKDMVALLRWVQQNIASFGGNPDDVTIAGYSAGAGAVDLLLHSDLSSGLFHKVIPESGVSSAVWCVQQDPLENANKIANSMNFTSSSVAELENFFTTASYELLTSILFPSEKDSSQFGPCIEVDVGQEIFLKDYPLNNLKEGTFTKVPMLLGHASAEGYARASMFDFWKDEMNQNFAEFLPADLVFPNEVEREMVAERIKAFYFGDEPVIEITSEGFIKYFGDVFFYYVDTKNAMYQAEAGNPNVYFYIYSFFDDSTVIPIMEPYGSLNVTSASHCAQSYAVHDMPGPRGINNDSDDYKDMRKFIREIWINFIRTGQPVPNGSTLIPEGWSPVSVNATPYMVLDKIPYAMYQLDEDRQNLWDDIYNDYYRPPIPPLSSQNYDN